MSYAKMLGLENISDCEIMERLQKNKFQVGETVVSRTLPTSVTGGFGEPTPMGGI